MAAGLDCDDVRSDRTDAESGSDPGDDIGGGHRPVQKQHVDQLAGRDGIAIGFAGSSPERLMRWCERAGLSGVSRA